MTDPRPFEESVQRAERITATQLGKLSPKDVTDTIYFLAKFRFGSEAVWKRIQEDIKVNVKNYTAKELPRVLLALVMSGVEVTCFDDVVNALVERMDKIDERGTF